MWIASKNGFFSIVKHDNMPDAWLIRARNYDDLLALFDSGRIITMTFADYRHRVIVNRNELHVFLIEQGNIDYTNFKDYIANSNQKNKLKHYHAIWHAMMQYQYENDDNKK